ncbi:MAG: PAS domain S-box protein [Thermodesulfobacteriota bacterium]
MDLTFSEYPLNTEGRYRAFLDFLPDPVFVFNLDHTVQYLNPAFEKVFGWTLEEVRGKRIPFVPEHEKERTRQEIRRFFENGVLYGFETQRLTKDGRLLDIVIDGAIFFDASGHPAGQVITLRDITEKKKAERINNALFRIASSLSQYRKLDDRLIFVMNEIQGLLNVENSSVILADEVRGEFYFRITTQYKRLEEIRFPIDKGVAAKVYRSLKPMIINDYYNSPYFFPEVDRQSGYITRNMLDVPLRTAERTIGVLCAVNKRDRNFDTTDADLLTAIASTVAYSIENAIVNEDLKQSLAELQTLSQAKERVIHHLSHELKTPVSVLSASIGILKERLTPEPQPGIHRILDRSRRNLERLLAMQYEIEDILRKKHFETRRMMQTLLEVCRDGIETAADSCGAGENLIACMQHWIDDVFDRGDEPAIEIALAPFAQATIDALRPLFAHRFCRVELALQPAGSVMIPPSVLQKIITGLVRNAVENTPDGGLIRVETVSGPTGPELIITDYGIGIPAESQKLLFEGQWVAPETMSYATRNPFDFMAGGRGFDLLRMKIFSERYHFDLQLRSNRCKFIPAATDRCPGSISACRFCSGVEDCIQSGGTTARVAFMW